MTPTTIDLEPASPAGPGGTADAEPAATLTTTPTGRDENPRSQSRLVVVSKLTEARRDAAKPTFTTRRVPPAAMRTLLSGALRPRSGDLVLAVIERIGHHTRVELPSGRKARVMAGDEIIVTYADRYAPDQFESHVPANLGPTELVASGGIASGVLSKSSAVRSATRIRPVGLIGDSDGRAINIADFAMAPVGRAVDHAPVIAVIGTSMNSGKTTTITHLAHGLHRAGRRPGVAKVTGTGSGNDFWVQVDAGAHRMLDFTDAGYASTYRVPMRDVERIFVELVDHLAAANSGALLLEVADGIYQQETARLIDSAVFRDAVDGVIFAAGEAMGAAQGVNHLRAMGLPVFAVSGRLTISPLATREAVIATGLPVFTLDDLHDPERAVGILQSARAEGVGKVRSDGVGSGPTNGHATAPTNGHATGATTNGHAAAPTNGHAGAPVPAAVRQGVGPGRPDGVAARPTFLAPPPATDPG